MENKEKSMFAAVISSADEINNNHDWKISTLNNGVPVETVIMQLKALIKNFENSYFNDFNNKLIK